MHAQGSLPPASWRLAAALLVTLGLALLAFAAVRSGTYYDDEIFTIRLLRLCPTPTELIACANSRDVHPPLGYLLDAALRGWLGSWAAVKLAKGLAMALAAGWLAWSAGRALPRPAFILLTALLALDGTLVMWTSSLRWYGWFVPLFTVCLAQVLWGRLSALGTLALLTGAGLLLFHVNYLAVIAMPLLGLGWWRRFGAGLSHRERGLALALVGAGLLACLPQAAVLARVHLHYHGPQTGSPVMALVQTGLTIFPGTALFPLAPLSLLASGTFAFAAMAAWRQRLRLPPGLLMMLAFGAAVMIASGLGYRHRNSLFLHVTALPLVASVLAAIARPRWRAAAVAIVLAASLQGALNAARHVGTIKRSYNTPYPAMLDRIARWGKACPHYAVAHTDIVLAELLRGRAVQTGLGATGSVVLAPGDCLIVVSGSAAASWPEETARWRETIAAAPARGVAVVRFSPEPGAALVGRLTGHPVEDHAATLRLLRLTGPATIPEFGSTAPLLPPPPHPGQR